MDCRCGGEMAVERTNLSMKEREGVTTVAKSLSRLHRVMYMKERVTLDKIKNSIPIEMRRKANAETMANFVLLRSLLITCIFSTEIVTIMSGKEGLNIMSDEGVTRKEVLRKAFSKQVGQFIREQ